MAKTATNTEKISIINKTSQIKKSHAVKPKKVTPTRRSSVRIATKLSLQSDVSKARKKGKGPIKKRPIKLTVDPPCSNASTPGHTAASTLYGLKQDGDKTNIKDKPMKGTDEEAATVEDAHTLKGDRANLQAKAKEGKEATIESNPVQEAVPVNDSFWEVPAMIAADDPQPSTPPTMPLEFTSSCFSGPFIQGDIEQFQKRTGENFASKQLFDENESDTPLPFNSSPDLFTI